MSGEPRATDRSSAWAVCAFGRELDGQCHGTSDLRQLSSLVGAADVVGGPRDVIACDGRGSWGGSSHLGPTAVTQEMGVRPSESTTLRGAQTLSAFVSVPQAGIIADMRSTFRLDRCDEGQRVRGRHRGALVAGSLLAATLGIAFIAGVPSPAYAAPALTASPGTGLSNGQSVTLTGSGYANSSIGNVLECNSDPNQPTVHLGGVVNSDVPVGCIPPSLMKLVNTDASGNVSTTFTVTSGVLGPPCGPSPDAATCPATDSAGQDPTADAAKYPCPPTTAQQTAGDTCNLTYGDATGESASATILFGSETAPSSTPTTAAPASVATTKPPTTAAPAPTTAAATATAAASTPSASTLASTGSGAGVRVIALAGLILVYLGGGMLTLGRRRRRFLSHAAGRDGADRDGRYQGLWLGGSEPKDGSTTTGSAAPLWAVRDTHDDF